jgi:DNA-binding CsgD family transcriptional regulator
LIGACDGVELLGVLAEAPRAARGRLGQPHPAELEVVRLVGQGLRNEAIARQLFIAPGTVKVHLSHIFTKLGVATRAELAAQAALRGDKPRTR